MRFLSTENRANKVSSKVRANHQTITAHDDKKGSVTTPTPQQTLNYGNTQEVDAWGKGEINPGDPCSRLGKTWGSECSEEAGRWCPFLASRKRSER